MAYGRKIGDAWIGIHARSAGTEREIERIAQSDADAYAKSFDKTWDDSVKARYARSQRILADALDTGSMKALIKEHGTWDNAMARSRAELRRLNREGLLSDERMREGLSLLTEHGRQYRVNERQSRRFANSLEAMGQRLQTLGETDLAKVLASGEWSKAIKDVDTLDDTTRRYNQTLSRLHAEKRITKKEMTEYRNILQRVFDQTLDQIMAEEELAQKQERQREILLAHGEALKENDKWERERAARLAEARKEQESFNRALQDNIDSYDKMRDRDLAAIINGNVDWAKVRRNYGGLNEAYDNLVLRMVELEDQSKITTEQIETSSTRIATAIRKVGKEDSRSGFGRLSQKVVDFDRNFGRTSRNFEINIGRMFGRGSRNNFVNLIGGLTQAFVTLPGAALRALTGIAGGIGKVITRFGDLRKMGVGRLAASFKAIGPLAANLAGTFVTLAVGALAVATALPMLVSGLTMLLGAITAVAGAIVTALLGSIVAVLPIIGALGVAAGGIAIAIAAAKDNSEEWGKAVSGLKDVFGDLKKEALPILEDVMELMPRLEGHFRDLGRVGLAAVDEMVGGFERFLDNLDSPEMKQFYEQWGESIPKIIGEVSDGLADLATGLVAWLAPVLPYAERLAENFANAMETFKEWSSSAEGQNSIADWMDIAWEAAEDLWNTLSNVWDILGSIFTSATEGAGGSFLRWLEDVTAEWAAFLDTPEGQQALKDFWADVEEFMISVKDLFGQFIALWDELDTDAARDNFNTMLSAIEGILEAVRMITPLIESWQNFLKGFTTGWDVGGFWGAMAGGAASVISTLDTIKIKMMNLGLIENPLDKFFENASKMVINLSNALPKSFPIPEKEWVSQTYTALQEVGKTAASGFNTGIDLGLGSPTPGVSDDPLSKWFRKSIDGDALGVELQNHYRSQVRMGLTGIEEAGPYADQSMEAIRQRMLESEAITAQDMADMWQIDAALQALPEQVAVSDAADQISDYFKEALGFGMGDAADEATSVFGNQFTSGMGGFSSTAGLQMMAIGLSLSDSMSQGVTTSMAELPGAISGAFEGAKLAAALGATETGQAAGDMSAAGGMVNTTMPQMTLALQAQMAAARIAASLGAIEISLAGGDLTSMTPRAQTTSAAFVPMIGSVMAAANTVATTGASNIVSSGSNLGSMPGAARTAISGLPTSIGSVMSAAVNTAATRAGEIRGAGSNIGGMVGSARAAISGLGGAIGGVMSAAYATASYWAGRIRAAFDSARAAANAGISIGMPRMASGGVVYGAQAAVIGEAGMEAVVPLNRNLATVHPSVRDLSAFAQGKFTPGESGPRVIIENGAIQVNTVTQNPEIVAESLLDRIVANVDF